MGSARASRAVFRASRDTPGQPEALRTPVDARCAARGARHGTRGARAPQMATVLFPNRPVHFERGYDTVATDAGGKRTTSANYTNDGSAGGIVGIATVAAPAGTLKTGYAAQLFDVTGAVPQNTAATVQGSFGGFTGLLNLIVAAGVPASVTVNVIGNTLHLTFDIPHGAAGPPARRAIPVGRKARKVGRGRRAMMARKARKARKARPER